MFSTFIPFPVFKLLFHILLSLSVSLEVLIFPFIVTFILVSCPYLSFFPLFLCYHMFFKYSFYASFISVPCFYTIISNPLVLPLACKFFCTDVFWFAIFVFLKFFLYVVIHLCRFGLGDCIFWLDGVSCSRYIRLSFLHPHISGPWKTR